MRYFYNTCAFIFVGSVLLCSCKKKIETISSSDSLVFGNWRYISSSGGISGGGDTDMGPDNSIEFKDHGKYLKYKGDKKVESSPFEFRDGKCIHANAHVSNVITILDGANVSYSFLVKGDTLFMDAEIADGFSYIYLKK